MSILLHDITYYHSDRTLVFEQLNSSIATGQHVNLIGNNGAGKSTLLKIMAGRLLPASGTVSTVALPYYVPQQLEQVQEQTVATALGVAQQLTALQAILRGETDSAHFDTLADAWDIEEQVQQALAQWQLSHINPAQPMHLLSGGEQTRVLLAGMQLHAPPVILLDEPTNHLDKTGREQLYQFITRYKGTLVVISHDRTLLELNDTTLTLANGKLEVYGGNYSFYTQRREEQLAALQQRIHHDEKELKLAKKQAQQVKERRQRQEGRGNRQTGLPTIVANALRNNAEQSTARLQAVQAEKLGNINDELKQQWEQLAKEQLLQLQFPAPAVHQGKKLVQATDIDFSYTGQPLWKTIPDFQINCGDRLQIRGNNGSGKTTLLKLIMGTLSPTSGTLERMPCQIVYLDQHYSFINGNNTVFEQLSQYNHKHLPPHTLKLLLHQYQLGIDLWNKPCAQLSGGEKMKLTICCLFVSQTHADMIVLDEPGNNLDISSLQVLTHALQVYEGALVLVSHDTILATDLAIEQVIEL